MKPYEPRILILDIENTPMLTWTWVMHEAEVLKVERHSYLLSFAFQWFPEQTIHVRSLRKYPGYDPGKHDDKPESAFYMKGGIETVKNEA